MEQEQLVSILQKFVAKNKRQLEKYKRFQDQMINEKEEAVKKITEDIKNIVEVDFSLIEGLVNSFLIANEEKKAMLNELKLVIQLISLNVSDGTTLNLNSKQTSSINSFLKNANNYLADWKKFWENNHADMEKVQDSTKMCKKILRSLSNPKNMSFITDTLVLDDIFDKVGVTLEDRNDMYQFILKYNRKIFDYKTGNCNVRELEALGKIDPAKLKDIFFSFGYDFSKLASDIQENIIERATVSNISSVFSSLANNGYQLDINNDQYLLMSLLVEGDASIINRISSMAFSKGLAPHEVLQIGSILIKQSRSKVRSSRAYERFRIDDDLEKGLKIVGAADDFVNNVEELGKWGFSVRYVYDRYKYVLSSSNDVLRHNLNLFRDYGFSLKSEKNKLCSGVMAALLGYNTVEVIDRFIEVHPLGINYLRNNLSVLRQIKNLDDLVFYKLYYSYKHQGSEEAFIKIITNDDEVLCMQGEVGGLSSIYMEGYAGINEDNKLLATEAFKPTYSRDYYSLIKNKIDKEIMASIFDNDYVQYVNKYSDKNEPLLYDFDGIRISKMKTLRVFDTLLSVGVIPSDESFLFALLYNTIITRADYDKLVKMVKLES